MRMLFSKSFVALLGIWFFASIRLFAVEGMWLPILLKQLNEAQMKEMGMRISAEDLYSINEGSLKDAIFLFGGGCTSEIISSEGLLLTNHHCGYSYIQRHSSLEKNYLRDGFTAKTRADEIPNPGLTATRIVRIEDVTLAVLAGAENQDGSLNQEVIQANVDRMVAQTEEGSHYKAEVKPFFYGNQYFLFVTETFEDIRLVMAPPSYIGKFGYDADNWMWPRHTGDFSVFRIYANQNNEPAPYALSNKPYSPHRSLKVSLAGIKQGDFTLVYGFPGKTEEYLPSQAIDLLMQTTNPGRIEIREKALSVINKAMLQSEDMRIKYAAKQSRVANYWKKWIGENRGLKKLNAVKARQVFEASFVQAGGDQSHLTRFKSFYREHGQILAAYNFYLELLYSGPEILRFAQNYSKLVEQAESLSAKGTLDGEVEKLKQQTQSFYKNYVPAIDRQILEVVLPVFLSHTAKDVQPENLAADMQKEGADAFARKLFESSVFNHPEDLEEVLADFYPKGVKRLSTDPLLLFSNRIYKAIRTRVVPEYTTAEAELERLMRPYMKSLMAVLGGKTRFYPDANRTLRVAYGKVEGYQPADGVRYGWQTLTTGILQKYRPSDPDFHLPERFVELLKAQDFAPYSKGKSLAVAFVASNHTTGGNSGSPVLNADGHLIGLNFDRSWESTMSDIMYDPERCRNIAVDARYLCWVMDKVMDGKHLVDELDLVYQ